MMLRRRLIKIIFGLGLTVAAIMLSNSSTPAQAETQPPTYKPETAVLAAPRKAEVTIHLCAAEGTVSMPDGTPPIPIWGYASATPDGSGGFTCSGVAATLPGPELRVKEGDTVVINLTNNLTFPTSILFPAIPDVSPPWDLLSNPGEAAASGGTVTYTLPNVKAGTYLYESGTDTNVQVPMGLYGALIVEKLNEPFTTYHTDEVLVLSEIDPDFNDNPTGFDMLDYAPKYWLINGKAYPHTTDTDPIFAAAGSTVRLRYLNAGAIHHTMSSLNLRQEIVSKEGFDFTYTVKGVAETTAAGRTTDTLVVIPAGAIPGTTKFPLYNRQLHLTNGPTAHVDADGGGGMMTYIHAGTPNLDLVVEVDGVKSGYPVLSYGGGQDQNPTWTLEDINNTLHIVGNGFKQVELGRAVNPSTMLEFNFKSTAQGEVHGLGFDANDSLPPDVGFQLYGTQTWTGGGNVSYDFENYAAAAPNSKHYVIPVGQFYTGSGDLMFANDHDVGSPTAEGLFSNIKIYDQQLYFSTAGGGAANSVPGVSTPYDDADIYNWDGDSFDRLFDARSPGNLILPGNADIDGLVIVDNDTFYVSFLGATAAQITTITGFGDVQDEDVVLYDAGTWSMFFDGSDHGLGVYNGQDLDAIDVDGTTFYFSTAGANAAANPGMVPGVAPPYDDADIYSWDGTNFTRVFDARSPGNNILPGNADIDGLVMLDDDTFYVSFRGATPAQIATIPGIGDVQDEDVVLYDAGTWSLYFDGSVEGTLDATNGQDLDAISIVTTN